MCDSLTLVGVIPMVTQDEIDDMILDAFSTSDRRVRCEHAQTHPQCVVAVLKVLLYCPCLSHREFIDEHTFLSWLSKSDYGSVFFDVYRCVRPICCAACCGLSCYRSFICRAFDALQRSFDAVDSVLGNTPRAVMFVICVRSHCVCVCVCGTCVPDYLEGFLREQSAGGTPFPFELFGGRRQDPVQLGDSHATLSLAAVESRQPAEVVLPSLNIVVPVHNGVTVLCGPVIGKVGQDGAIVMLEVDRTAIGYLHAGQFLRPCQCCHAVPFQCTQSRCLLFHRTVSQRSAPSPSAKLLWQWRKR